MVKVGRNFVRYIGLFVCPCLYVYMLCLYIWVRLGECVCVCVYGVEDSGMVKWKRTGGGGLVKRKGAF